MSRLPVLRNASSVGRGVGRQLLRWLAAVAVLGALVFAAGMLWLWRTVTPLTGEAVVRGLAGPVEVVMRPDAVPHVFAGSKDDLYAALGLLHAQHRLWQMELMRRAGQGRLPEVFGGATLDRDKFIRTLDIYGHAVRSVARLGSRSRAALESYSRGVNAWIDRPTGVIEPRLAPEFYLLRHAPEPWRPADSIAILKMMALQLGRNLDKEIDRLAFAAYGLSPDEIEDLLPTIATWGAPPLPDIRRLYPLRRPEGPLPSLRAELDLPVMSGGASNNWVVDGRRTRSGKPLLAGDPHLRLTAPSTWFLVHLALVEPGGGTANIVGASLPGTPLVPLGRGDTFAWALTNTESDVADLFVEQLNPADSGQYRTPDGWRPFGRRSETIRARGGGDVALDVRMTRHGPVISSVYRGLDRLLPPDYVVAVQWVGLTDDDATIEALLFDSSIRGVDEAIARTRPTVGPMQSMVVADSDGATGLVAPGRLPIRAPGNAMQGRAPVAGWEATNDWLGFVPFEALPRQSTHDPASNGTLATTNTAIVGHRFPHLLAWDWGPPFRQQRIEALLAARPVHDVESMRAAQLDVISLAAARLAPRLVAAVREAAPETARRHAATLDSMARWDGAERGAAPEPLLFTAWLRHALDHVFRDDLGHAWSYSLDERVLTLMSLVEGRPMARDWCDDRRTPEVESCGLVLARALDAAVGEISQRFGPDRVRWRWDTAHYADGIAEPFGRLPLIGDVFNVRVPSDGGSFTLNRGKSYLASSEPFANRDGTTFRAIYDLADLEASLFIQSTGQSGNPFSPHYRSLAERWARGEYVKIPTRREAVEGQAIGRWRLVPGP